MGRKSSLVLVLALCLALVPLLAFAAEPARASATNPPIINPITNLADSVVLTGYNYQKPVSITNSGSTLTDYQMLFTVDTASLVSAGKLRSDCGDLRFATAAGTQLSYWIESGANTSATKVWVKVPSIPASGSTTIYMCYGNSGAASASSGTTVFELFDDFESYSDGTTISNWTEVDGDWIIGTPTGKTKAARLNDTGGSSALIRSSTYSGARVIEAELMLESFVNNNPHPGIVVGYQDNNNYNAIYWRGPYAQLVRWQVSNGIEDNVDLANLTGGTQGTYHTIRAAIDNAGNVVNVKFLSYDGNPGFAVQITGAGLWQHRLESWLGWCDNFRVRKYASPEPTYYFGSEEPQSALASTSLTVSPSSFTLTSEGATTLTVTLTSGGSPLVGKTVTLSASSGSTNPSSGTTNSSGQVTVTYTAPSVTTQTSVTITASFAGDNSYQASSATSYGTIYGTTTPSGAYIENFDDAAGMTSVSGYWYYTAGTYALSGEPQMSGASYSTEIPVTTCDEVSVKFKLISSSSWQYAGVMSKYNSTTNSGMFGFVNQNSMDNYLGIALGEYVNGDYGNYDSIPLSKISFGTWHSLKLAASGSSYSLYLDGTVVLTFSSTRFTSGRAGLWAYRGSPVYFDNLTVSGTVVAAPTTVSTTLSISPSSFTLQSDNSTTLAATLKDNANNPLAYKTITWSKTAGSLSATSGTTDALGQVTVTYSAPTVTAQTSVTITASFAGDASYQFSSSTSVGTISPPPVTGEQEIIVNGGFSTGDATGWTWGFAVEPTYGSVPIYSITNNAVRFYRTGAGSTGRGCCLYQDINANVSSASELVLSFKVKVDYQSLATISSDQWGPAYVEIKYLDSNGQERWYWQSFYYQGNSTQSIVEKIPQSTWISRSYNLTTLSPKPATIKRVSLATWGWDYDSSFDDVSLIHATEAVATPTSLSISPPAFALYPGYSGQVQSLTATLRDSNYSTLAGKTITWSATSGSISPSSGTTDALGQVSVVYTAPTVTAETPQVAITASFAGDAQYNSSSGTSSGIPAAPVSENIPASTGGTVIVNVIELNVTVNILVVPPNALSENKTVTVTQAPPENVADHAMVSGVFDVGPSGTTFTTPSTLTLPYNENELPAGVSEDNLAIYRRTGPKSWERVGGNVDKAANTVTVQIDHLSAYAVMAETPAAVSPAVAAGISILGIAALVCGVFVVAFVLVWLRRSAREISGSIKRLERAKRVAPPEKKPPLMKAPPKLSPAEIESRVYEYIKRHRGELDPERCAKELGLSEREVGMAVEVLKAKGKVAEE